MDLIDGVFGTVDVCQYEFNNGALEEFEAGDLVAEAGFQEAEQTYRRLGVFDGEPCGFGGGWLGEQTQDGGRDDAECAFCADEQMFHVVAGVVFPETTQAVPDFTVGEYNFEAEDERAGVPIAQHLGAAGVGGNVAADLAGAFSTEAEGEEAVVFSCDFLDALQDDAGLDGQGIVVGIDLAHGVHARCRDDDFGHVAVWLAGAGEAGVAALGDDRGFGLGAEFDEGCDFFCGFWAQEDGHRALPVIAPARAVAFEVCWVVNEAGGADDVFQPVDDRLINGIGRAQWRCHLRSSSLGVVFFCCSQARGSSRCAVHTHAFLQFE